MLVLYQSCDVGTYQDGSQKYSFVCTHHDCLQQDGSVFMLQYTLSASLMFEWCRTAVFHTRTEVCFKSCIFFTSIHGSQSELHKVISSYEHYFKISSLNISSAFYNENSMYRIAVTLDVKIVWFGCQGAFCVNKWHKNTIFGCSWFQKLLFTKN